MPNAEFLHYNKLTVTICDNLIISNINTKGRPGADCGAYLTSLDINSAATEQSGTSTIGASGSISAIDYKHAVSNALIKHYNKYSANSGNPCAPVKIELECFTGKKTFEGFITDWKLSFTGSVPEISMTWTVVGTSMPPKAPLEPCMFTKPGALIKYIQDTISDKDEKYDFIFVDSSGKEYVNEDIDNALVFTGGYARLMPEHLNSTGELLLDVYKFICQSCETKAVNPETGVGNPISATKEIVDKVSAFRVGETAPDKTNPIKNEETNIFADLIFVFNSHLKPYTQCKELDNKYVIPLSSFSCDLDFKSMAQSASIKNTMNGSIVTGTANNGTSVDGNKTDIQIKGNAESSSDAITMSFECYNVGHFVCNNLNAPIATRIYDEDGMLIDYLSRNNLIVKSVKYNFSGPVVKASCECTAAFGASVTSTTTANPRQGGDDKEDSSGK